MREFSISSPVVGSLRSRTGVPMGKKCLTVIAWHGSNNILSLNKRNYVIQKNLSFGMPLLETFSLVI